MATLLLLLVALIPTGRRIVSQHVRFSRDKQRVEPQLVVMTPLIDALELYKQDHGRYPIRLDALVPKYLPVLPRLHWPLSGRVPGEGNGYEYAVEPGGAYVLMAQVSRKPNHYACDWREYIEYRGTDGHATSRLRAPYGRIWRWDYFSSGG